MSEESDKEEDVGAQYDEPKEFVELSSAEKIKTIPSLSSESLAVVVIAYKAFSRNKEFAAECMKELGRRRKNGDEFEFEKYIENEVAKMPQPATTPGGLAGALKLIAKSNPYTGGKK